MDKIIKKNKWTPLRIVFIMVPSIMVISFVIFSFKESSILSFNVEKDKIIIAEVSKGSFAEFIPVDGNVQPIKSIYLDVIQGGYVEKKFIEGGNMVETGAPLLKLSNNNLMLDYVNKETIMYDLINNLQNSRLSIKQNKFNVRKRLSQLDFQIAEAKDLYERNLLLYKDKVISEQEFLKGEREYTRLKEQYKIEIESYQFDSANAINQVAQLEGSLQRTYRNLALFKENLNNLYINSPVSGQLASLNVEIGQYITTGQRIGQVDDLSGFKVRAGIDEHYISRIFTGLKGEFEYAGKMYMLTIKRVYPEVQGGRFQVDMEFDGEHPKAIRRGQTLQIKLQLSDPAPATIVSRGGFYQTTGGNWIFVLGKDGKTAERRQIKLGRQNPQYYEVLEGLNPGEKVVVSSYENWDKIDRLNIQ